MEIKHSISQNFHLIFIVLFFLISGYLSLASPLWADEHVYLILAEHVLADPLTVDPMLSWVPHPPLVWYLAAVFNFMPRLVSLLSSALCTYILYHVSKKLYGEAVAKFSVAVLLSTLGYMLYSAVLNLDGPMTAFTAMSVLSFHAWMRLKDQKYLLLSGLGLGLASLTKYPAAPILLGSFCVWLILARKNLTLPLFLKMAAVLAVALIPLALWIYTLSGFYGNFVHKYSKIYDLFIWDPHLFAINVICYIGNAIMLCGFPLFSWIRKRPFDHDSRMLLAYSAVVFALYIFITPWSAIIYPSQLRYLLPVVPTTTIISAKSLAKEKTILCFLILSLQFTYATLFSLLLLTYPSFIFFLDKLYSLSLSLLGQPLGGN